MNQQFTSLSKRGDTLATNPARIDTEMFIEASQNLYCPNKNPEGAFTMNVAENSLMTSMIKDQLSSIIQEQEMPDWVLKYTNMIGHHEVRAEVARFMEEYLCKCPIDPDAIGFSAGASAIIEVSSFVLANPGDVVVIPAPSYPVYTNDFGLKSGVERYDLQTHYHLEEMGNEAPVKVEMLDKVLNELNDQGKCFKLLLITSPDNPMGCMYAEHELKELAKWCVQHEVHMIVNEIYRLSLIDTQDPAIQHEYKDVGVYASFAKIMAELNSDYLHLWYALSKDFAMSGLRFGVVHSLNRGFIKGLQNVNLPHMVSNITQWMIGEMFKDSSFIEAYIKENKVRLTQSYKLVIATLKNLGVPYYPSRGSLFVWADFSKYLDEDSEQGQEQLWIDIYKNTGILLTPGKGFQHQKKGLFRIVYTAVPYTYLQVAMERLTKFLSTK